MADIAYHEHINYGCSCAVAVLSLLVPMRERHRDPVLAAEKWARPANFYQLGFLSLPPDS